VLERIDDQMGQGEVLAFQSSCRQVEANPGGASLYKLRPISEV